MKHVKYHSVFPLFVCIGLLAAGCLSAEDKSPAGKEHPLQGETAEEGSAVMGFGILPRLPGLWNGPVFSDTPAGSFERWYVDFRPVSPGEVVQYSTLDEETKNIINFFIVKHEDRLKVAMRTEGVFRNKGCVTYEVIEDLDESAGYYRFSDFRAGSSRAYTEFRFKEDELVMDVYTNKFNTVSPLTLHSRWKAVCAERGAAQDAINDLDFPLPVMVKDFSNAFRHMSESIFFTFENDPYPASRQPYMGSVSVAVAFAEDAIPGRTAEIFLILATESLFEGLVYKKENLKYISRYVYLPPGTASYTFSHVHPGTYFLYAYADVNGDRKYETGDYMSAKVDHSFSLETSSHADVATVIDYRIP
ncbi:MAG: hypothetical protein JW881_16450 [Spirochaetales bacterium]|nr:hypothetical protein [Spirochaetales bacterium]